MHYGSTVIHRNVALTAFVCAVNLKGSIPFDEHILQTKSYRVTIFFTFNSVSIILSLTVILFFKLILVIASVYQKTLRWNTIFD